MNKYSNKITSLILISLFIVSLSGCGIQQMVVRKATGPIIDGGFASMMSEDDIILAKTGLESNLKLVEGLLVSDPENEKLMLIAAQGFTAYALAFAEDEDPERASRLYLRGREYANQWIKKRYDINLLEIYNLDDFNSAVDALPEKAMPGVFWLGNSWASSLMLSLTDVSAVSSLPKVEKLMRFAMEIDEDYYFAGAHLFFGGYYGARSTFLGGSPQKAKEHLDRQIELTNGNVLLGKLFMAKYVHVPALDEEATRSTLEEIFAFDINSAPDDTRLINQVAKIKAQKLAEYIEDYF